jgi:Tol biopolymer transport system component
VVALAGLAAATAACASAHAVVHNRAPRPRPYALVFASSRDGRYQIYGRSADGSTERRLTQSSANDVEPAVSRDGRWIAFVRAAAPSSATGELWVMHPDGSGARRLLGGVSAVTPPTFSPDGRRLAAALGSDGTRGLDILTLAGGRSTVLHLSDAGTTDPDWSPSGRDIAVSVVEGSAWVPEIVTPDGSDQRVFDVRGNVDELRWSPDGRELAYAVIGARGGIFVARRDGSHRREIESAASEMRQGLAWAPDGDHLIYVSAVDSVGLRSVDVRSGVSSPLGPVSRNDVEPAVGPPAAVPIDRPGPGTIAFTSDRDGLEQIYTMSADGRDQTRRSPPGAATNPDWSPDGRLAFVRSTYHGEVPRSSVDVTGPFGVGPRPVLTVYDGFVTEMVWSPTSDRLAVVTYTHGSYTAEVVPAAGGRPVVLSTGQRDPHVDWYADGRGVLIVLRGATTDIEWERPDGGLPHVIEHGPSWVYGVDAAPSGDAVAAALGGTAEGSVWVLDQRWRRIVRDRGRLDLGPVWSPDGRWIAFWRAKDVHGRIGTGPEQLAVVPADGGRPRVLATAGTVRGHELVLGWDGPGALLFTARVDGQLRLERVPLAGGPARILGDSRSNFDVPAVFPAGRRF